MPIKIQDLENRIFEFEHVRVVFRAPSILFVDEYPFKNMIGDSMNFSVFQDRINNSYAGLPFIVLDGFGIEVKRLGRKMGEIRQSYIKHTPILS